MTKISNKISTDWKGKIETDFVNDMIIYVENQQSIKNIELIQNFKEQSHCTQTQVGKKNNLNICPSYLPPCFNPPHPNWRHTWLCIHLNYGNSI